MSHVNHRKTRGPGRREAGGNVRFEIRISPRAPFGIAKSGLQIDQDETTAFVGWHSVLLREAK
jgi:hypothetical protein